MLFADSVVVPASAKAVEMMSSAPHTNAAVALSKVNMPNPQVKRYHPNFLKATSKEEDGLCCVGPILFSSLSVSLSILACC